MAFPPSAPNCAALIISAIFAVAALSSTATAHPQAVDPPTTSKLARLSVVAPVTDCAQLAEANISPAVGAQTRITAAEPVPDAKPAAYCRVTGYVEPAIKFEVRLPLMTWTQRYVQTGCGGLCGSLHLQLSNAQDCYPANHGELVLASTDMGTNQAWAALLAAMRTSVKTGSCGPTLRTAECM